MSLCERWCVLLQDGNMRVTASDAQVLTARRTDLDIPPAYGRWIFLRRHNQFTLASSERPVAVVLSNSPA